MLFMRGIVKGKQGLMAAAIALGLSLCLSGCKGADETPTEAAVASTEAAVADESVRVEQGETLEKEASSESELRAIAAEMIDALSDLVSCDSYVNAMAGSTEISKVVEEWKTAKVDKSLPFYVYTIDSKALESYIGYSSEGELELTDMPDNIKAYINSKYAASLISIINSSAGGVSVLAASSVVNYSKTFVPEESLADQMWMIPCNDLVAVCISFTNTGNGVLTATASYAAYSEEGCEALLTGMGLSSEKMEW